MKETKGKLKQFLAVVAISVSTFTSSSFGVVIAVDVDPLCESQPACTEPPCKMIQAEAKMIATEIYEYYVEAENEIAEDYRDKIVKKKKEIRKIALEIDRITAKLELLERDNIMTMKKLIKESIRAHELEATDFFFKEIRDTQPIYKKDK